MARDWRTVVCTRRRVPVLIALVAIVWLATGLVSSLIGNYQMRGLQKKAASLKVGMTEIELAKIMGQRKAETRISNSEIIRKSGVENKFLIEYSYWIQSPFFTPSTFLGGIFLDEKSKTIELLQPSQGLMEVDGVSRLPAIILVGVLALLTWLLFRSWCKRTLKKVGM